MATELGTRALYRQVVEAGDGYVLRESGEAYSAISGPKIEALGIAPSRVVDFNSFGHLRWSNPAGTPMDRCIAGAALSRALW